MTEIYSRVQTLVAEVVAGGDSSEMQVMGLVELPTLCGDGEAKRQTQHQHE